MDLSRFHGRLSKKDPQRSRQPKASVRSIKIWLGNNPSNAFRRNETQLVIHYLSNPFLTVDLSPTDFHQWRIVSAERQILTRSNNRTPGVWGWRLVEVQKFCSATQKVDPAHTIYGQILVTMSLESGLNLQGNNDWERKMRTDQNVFWINGSLLRRHGWVLILSCSVVLRTSKSRDRFFITKANVRILCI